MRIAFICQGGNQVFDRDATRVVIGRSKESDPVDLDLGADRKVSRHHARIWQEDGQYWIEDLNSARGTLLNRHEIKGMGRQPLRPGDRIVIGDTVLWFEPVAGMETVVEQTSTALDASQPAFNAATAAASTTDRKLEILYRLPLVFGAETQLEGMLEKVAEQMLVAMPHARRSALLLKDRASGQLLLKAHRPPDHPAVSSTMARQAMEQHRALLWCAGAAADKEPSSIADYQITSAMYAPLSWKNEVFGVVCVDNSEPLPAFDGGDLQLLQAIAHHAAMAIAQHYTQQDLQRHASLTNRLFSSRFPPRVRESLQRDTGASVLARGAKLMPVTCLIADIRGFTRLTAELGAQRMSELMSEYFPLLIDAAFTQGGSIDRFVGDAMFVVFGSPEPDEKQHEHAVRAAVAMQAAVAAMSARRSAVGAATCEIGIGVDCGEALTGFIGNADRMEFTVVSEAANQASRYCAGAKPGEVLVSPAIHEHVWNLVEAERAMISTKHEGEIATYRVLRMKR